MKDNMAPKRMPSKLRNRKIPIIFEIEYYTEWGQSLYVVGNCSRLGSGTIDRAAPMEYRQGGKWTLAVSLDPSQELTYRYFLKDERGTDIFFEFGEERRVKLEEFKRKRVLLQDFWRPWQDSHNILYSSAFVNNLMRPKRRRRQAPVKRYNHLFRLYEPRIDPDFSFCLLGNAPQLGGWNPKKAVLMEAGSYPVWEARVYIDPSLSDIEYKFGLYDRKRKKIIAYESGENRHIRHNRDRLSKQVHIRTDNRFRSSVGPWKGAGTAIPLFSLRSANSAGVGEFADIKLLVDWAGKTGLQLIQLLPVNDTVASHRWIDSYPYAAISVFALHPLYLRMETMGQLKDERKKERYRKEAGKLNEMPEIDYEAVMKLKSRFCKELYDQERDAFFSGRRFLRFFKKNRDWLVPYAAFSCLRDRYQTPDFTAWPQYSCYDASEIGKFVDPKAEHYDDVAVHYFIQYHLHNQLAEAAQYARRKRVVLKGDIPIGICRNSVDAWVRPDLYHIDKQAGAPPDSFAVTGQNWGFPTYNWERMEEDGYAWWRKRLTHLQQYFDAYRLDHILGFFRIWEIPVDSVEGLMGRFNPAIPMSQDEMAWRGLSFNHERMCLPYIREYMVHELFGEKGREIMERFFHPLGGDFYAFKPEYNTQKKIVAHFSGKEAREVDNNVLAGLLSLVCNVLFLEAPGNPGHYHPRISLHATYSYRELDDYSKRIVDEIYVHYFYRRHEQFWHDRAMVKLPPIIESTNMLVCGEDLGMVPDCVPRTMQELKILSLEIQRMPKEGGRDFSDPAEAPYLSVVSTSSHDMPPIRGWWEEERAVTQHFYNTVLGHAGEAPYFCEPWICREIVNRHLHSPAMWAIFPLQDILAMDGEIRREDARAERINVPSNPHHYWRYRLHKNLEELIELDAFNGSLAELLTAAGRNRAL